MQVEDFERSVKVLVVGNGSVGKSSMIRRLCKGDFTAEYKKTIGVDFMERTQWVEALGEDVKLMVWDTAGQEEFDSITRTFYRGAGAAVLVFSTTDRASFEAVPAWKQKVEAEAGQIAMALVQNKVDLLDQAAVRDDEAQEMAKRLRLRFYRACVKDNLNVAEVFKYLAEQHTSMAAQPPAPSAETPGPATATATITDVASKADPAKQYNAMTLQPAQPSSAAGQPQSVNLKAKKGKQAPRFLQCSLA